MCLGIPGQIVAIDDAERKLATVEVGGVRRQINIACIVDDEHPPAACVGDWVLVHVGFAMSRIDEARGRARRCASSPNSARRRPSSTRCERPEGPRCPTRRISRRSIHFSHGQRAGRRRSSTPRCSRSVADKARDAPRRQRALLRRAGADAARRRAGARRRLSTAAAGCSRWAMAARAATPRTSRSSSCIRSPPGARRSPRSI